ncbi:hypothetical protein AGMMS49546_06650 [Spirochaetia bacterium]|nr:hypothetical protein AGMMS49546_06650 [Spirochaetia bacterium]
MRQSRTPRAALRAIFTICLWAVLFSSCIGVKADITLKADGSGRISLEYRVSRLLGDLGQLDGNQGQPTIPTGRADFERSLDRLPGLKLASYSTKQDETDTITRADIDFASLEDLLPFLDAAGEGVSLSRAGGKTSLRLTLSSGAENIEPELLSLVESVSQGYKAAISLSGPRDTALALFDHGGKPLRGSNGIEWVQAGKKTSLAIPVSQLLALKEGLSLEFSW